jgi:membrane-associated protease RseP (regulator of RpoE activity)
LFVHTGMQNSMRPDAAKEIEHVKSLVARHFPVYDVRVNYDVVEFYCKIDETVLEESFERMREEMAPQGYIPMVTYDKGEHVIVVGKRPARKYRSVHVNLLMLIITFVAVMFAGILDWASYASVPGDEVYSLENITTGIIVFALPLLAILGVHELGHYFMARRRRVAASLPFFIPSIPPLGTFGAFISLRDPIPNRKSLLEIGVAGPIAGLLVALPLAIAGLMLTNMDARPAPDDFESGSIVRVAFPYIYDWLEQLMPIEGDYLLHPTAFAAWVGFLVTALNLLPAGQLDGGHISRALLGKNAKYASWATIAVLIVLSFEYFAWMLFAFLILILGAKHPPPLNDITKLDVKRQALGVVAFVILIVAFVPVPISLAIADHGVDVTPIGTTNTTLGPGETASFALRVENVGNVRNNITVETLNAPEGWEVWFRPQAVENASFATTWSYRYDISENLTFETLIKAASSSALGNESVTVVARSTSAEEAEGEVEDTVTFSLNVTGPEVEFWVPDATLAVAAGGEIVFDLQVNNTGEGNVSLSLSGYNLPSFVGMTLFVDEVDANSTGTFNLTVPAGGSSTLSALVFVSSSAEPGDRTLYIRATYWESELAVMEIVLTIT